MARTMSAVERGRWLIESLVESESALAGWLVALAEFDRDQGWAADGQLSCADWLMWRAGMSRSTAYERLQVAHALTVRPVVREALRSGRISYSVARLMARMERPAGEVDEAVVAVAETGTVRDVERLVRLYLRHMEQDRRPPDRSGRRRVCVRSGYDGTATIEITLDEIEVADFMAALDAFTAPPAPAEPKSEAPGSSADSRPSPTDQSARADDPAGGPAGAPLVTWSEVQADAVMEMVRTAVSNAGGDRATGEDRYLVHVVSHGGGMELLDGTVLDRNAAARIACDSSSVEILLGPEWEPLAMGRRSRTWTTAQRRAAMMRDGGACRFPGCARRHVDLHHHRWWARGGPTDVSNGYLACPRHHTLIHGGWTVEGDPNRELTFHRPDGSVLGSTRPRRRGRKW